MYSRNLPYTDLSPAPKTLIAPKRFYVIFVRFDCRGLVHFWPLLVSGLRIRFIWAILLTKLRNGLRIDSLDLLKHVFTRRFCFHLCLPRIQSIFTGVLMDILIPIPNLLLPSEILCKPLIFHNLRTPAPKCY